MVLNITDCEAFLTHELIALIAELLAGWQTDGVFIETALTHDQPQLIEQIEELNSLESIALAEQICKLLRLRLDDTQLDTAELLRDLPDPKADQLWQVAR